MKKIEIYSKEDTKTRKHWLLSLLILVGLNWLGFIGALFETNQEDLPLQTAMAIVSTITATMLYYFAYQKHGTRFLTWSLIGPILGWLRVLGSSNIPK